MSLDLPEGGRTCKRERDTALRMSNMKERFLNRSGLTLKEFQRHFHVPHFTDEEKLRGSAHSLLHGFPYEAVTEMIITRPHLTRHNDPTTKWASDLSRLIRILPWTFLTWRELRHAVYPSDWALREHPLICRWVEDNEIAANRITQLQGRECVSVLMGFLPLAAKSPCKSYKGDQEKYKLMGLRLPRSRRSRRKKLNRNSKATSTRNNFKKLSSLCAHGCPFPWKGW